MSLDNLLKEKQIKNNIYNLDNEIGMGLRILIENYTSIFKILGKNYKRNLEIIKLIAFLISRYYKYGVIEEYKIVKNFFDIEYEKYSKIARVIELNKIQLIKTFDKIEVNVDINEVNKFIERGLFYLLNNYPDIYFEVIKSPKKAIMAAGYIVTYVMEKGMLPHNGYIRKLFQMKSNISLRRVYRKIYPILLKLLDDEELSYIRPYKLNV
ncbi:MAG: hypothetical protein QW648_02755 [Nanoarchaeales archaeon]